jgi:hypothetical protein
MKFMLTILVLLLSVQSFARDHQEDRGRADRASEERRRNEERRRDGGGVYIGTFDFSNTLLLTSLINDPHKEAIQVINDSQEFIQSGDMSVLLDQKINEAQKINQDLSVEDALDLIVASAEAKL